MMSTTLRQLAPAAAAGLALSLLSTLPAGAHGLAGAGLAAGASHPLLGLDHLLLLLGVGGAAALAGPSLLLVALAAAISGGWYGAFGGNLPGAEVLAALMVSGLGLALAARQGQLLAVVLAGGVAIHAMLHGQEATGSSADLLGWWLGFGPFLGIYAAVLTLSAAIFIDVFFVQHIFEDSYAHRSEGWSHLEGALRGTSLLRLPPVLAWFTADIGFHNMHHLCERIPNYQLRACHEHNQHLLADVPTLTLGTMLACASYLLWDSRQDRLVMIASVGAGLQQRPRHAS